MALPVFLALAIFFPAIGSYPSVSLGPLSTPLSRSAHCALYRSRRDVATGLLTYIDRDDQTSWVEQQTNVRLPRLWRTYVEYVWPDYAYTTPTNQPEPVPTDNLYDAFTASYRNWRLSIAVTEEELVMAPLRAFSRGHYPPCDPTPWPVYLNYALAATFFTTFTLTLTWFFASTTPWREYASQCLTLSSHTLPDLHVIRSEFMNLVPPVFKPQPNHTHPTAARDRNAASATCAAFATLIGYEPFFVQMARSDQKHGYDGTRSYYWPKDLGASARAQPLAPNSIPILVDVDQYMDMPRYLAHNRKPVLITTKQPQSVSEVGVNASFTFDAHNVMHYTLSGGGSYTHPVWNYAQESITATDTFLGLPLWTTTYLVERMHPTKHEAIILLVPIAAWGILGSIWASLVTPTPLTRLRVNCGSHNRLQTRNINAHTVSTGVPGQYACADVPVSIDNRIALLAASSKAGLQRATILTHLPKTEDANELDAQQNIATILYDYHTINSVRTTPLERANMLFRTFYNAVTPTFASANSTPTYNRYQFGKFDQDAKPLLHAFMQPIIPGAFAPDKTRGNEERAVKKRITDVATLAPPTPFLTNTVAEFIKLLVPDAHATHPVSYEEVAARQNRPSQRIIVSTADDSGPNTRGRLASFVKAEAYPNAKDPRLISTYQPDVKVAYSRYTYALADHLKKLPCYAFSKPPTEVDEKVTLLCHDANTVASTDFSRFDGTISPAARFFERALLLRAFAPAYHSEVVQLHAKQYGLRARCTLGTVYDQGYARGSGSPETSVFNSVYNMFVSYLAHRMTSEDGVYQSCSLAWRLTTNGIYGGDDGLCANADADAVKRACDLLGLSIKIANIKRGQLGVVFLGRVYGPDVWTGDTSNCADLPRQLGKLHTSHMRPGVSDDQMALDKLASYALTDANTPVLGHLARVALKHAGELTATPQEGTWLSQQGAVFNNPPRDWYIEYATLALPEFNFERFFEWITTVRSLPQLRDPPPLHEAIPPTPADVDVVVNGDLIPATGARRTDPPAGKKADRRRSKPPDTKRR